MSKSKGLSSLAGARTRSACLLKSKGITVWAHSLYFINWLRAGNDLVDLAIKLVTEFTRTCVSVPIQFDSAKDYMFRVLWLYPNTSLLSYSSIRTT